VYDINPGPGVGASIVIPASAGIAHVATSVAVTINNLAAASFQQIAIFLNSTQIGWANCPGSPSLNAFQWTGEIVGPVGGSLTLLQNGNVPGGCYEVLEIQGYDL
jgi:hypothetical protein